MDEKSGIVWRTIRVHAGANRVLASDDVPNPHFGNLPFEVTTDDEQIGASRGIARVVAKIFAVLIDFPICAIARKRGVRPGVRNEPGGVALCRFLSPSG